MKLLDITVNNFRSINGDNVKISLEGSDIIFVFGQNNAGKSSLLSAYEYLVTPKQKSLLSDFLGFNEANPIEILATFSTSPQIFSISEFVILRSQQNLQYFVRFQHDCVSSKKHSPRIYLQIV